MSAIIFLFIFSPIDIIVYANCLDCSKVFINAPVPVLTSKTKPSVPLANFLLIIELEINGIDSTVPVTSIFLYFFYNVDFFNIKFDMKFKIKY